MDTFRNFQQVLQIDIEAPVEESPRKETVIWVLHNGALLAISRFLFFGSCNSQNLKIKMNTLKDIHHVLQTNIETLVDEPLRKEKENIN